MTVDRRSAIEGIADLIGRRIVVNENDCWIWQGAKVRKGYGVLSTRALGRNISSTHRIMCEFSHGPIPPGMQVDHLCREPSCCNPAHLEIVTPAQNTQRGDSPRLARLRGELRTHCPHGHPYDASNTYRSPKGVKFCLECKKRSHAEWAAKRRAKSALTAMLPRQSGETAG